jgi:hypothetical protein
MTEQILADHCNLQRVYFLTKYIIVERLSVSFYDPILHLSSALFKLNVEILCDLSRLDSK